jgi:hypothetical protein
MLQFACMYVRHASHTICISVCMYLYSHALFKSIQIKRRCDTLKYIVSKMSISFQQRCYSFSCKSHNDVRGKFLKLFTETIRLNSKCILNIYIGLNLQENQVHHSKEREILVEK